jgi:hypothetical protein
MSQGNEGSTNAQRSLPLSTSYIPNGDPGPYGGGTYTSHPTEPSVRDYENVFGPSARDIKDDLQKYKRHGRWHLPDILKGPNPWLTDRIDGLITDATNSPFTSIILPYKYFDNVDGKIKWNVWSFDEAMASRVPYEAAARTLTQSKRSYAGYAVRHGLAINLEHNFMMTPQGRENFQNQLKQLIGSIQYSNDLDVHMALILAPSYEKVQSEKYFGEGKPPAQICREFVDLFGFMQKNQNALDILIEESKIRLKTWGGPMPDFMLCNSKLGFQLQMVPERTNYLTQGPDGVKRLKQGPDLQSYRGLKIIHTRAFSLETGVAPRDMLRRRVRVAEYYRIPPSPDNWKREFELYNEARDNWFALAFVQLLKMALVEDQDPKGKLPGDTNGQKLERVYNDLTGETGVRGRGAFSSWGESGGYSDQKGDTALVSFMGRKTGAPKKERIQDRLGFLGVPVGDLLFRELQSGKWKKLFDTEPLKFDTDNLKQQLSSNNPFLYFSVKPREGLIGIPYARIGNVDVVLDEASKREIFSATFDTLKQSGNPILDQLDFLHAYPNEPNEQLRLLFKRTPFMAKELARNYRRYGLNLKASPQSLHNCLQPVGAFCDPNNPYHFQIVRYPGEGYQNSLLSMVLKIHSDLLLTTEVIDFMLSKTDTKSSVLCNFQTLPAKFWEDLVKILLGMYQNQTGRSKAEFSLKFSLEMRKLLDSSYGRTTYTMDHVCEEHLIWTLPGRGIEYDCLSGQVIGSRIYPDAEIQASFQQCEDQTQKQALTEQFLNKFLTLNDTDLAVWDNTPLSSKIDPLSIPANFDVQSILAVFTYILERRLNGDAYGHYGGRQPQNYFQYIFSTNGKRDLAISTARLVDSVKQRKRIQFGIDSENVRPRTRGGRAHLINYDDIDDSDGSFLDSVVFTSTKTTITPDSAAPPPGFVPPSVPTPAPAPAPAPAPGTGPGPGPAPSAPRPTMPDRMTVEEIRRLRAELDDLRAQISAGGGSGGGSGGGGGADPGQRMSDLTKDIEIVIIRPNIEHYMLGIIMGLAGENLGNTLWGQTELSVYDDSMHGVWGMSYK